MNEEIPKELPPLNPKLEPVVHGPSSAERTSCWFFGEDNPKNPWILTDEEYKPSEGERPGFKLKLNLPKGKLLIMVQVTPKSTALIYEDGRIYVIPRHPFPEEPIDWESLLLKLP